jgi:hypothetical protein
VSGEFKNAEKDEKTGQTKPAQESISLDIEGKQRLYSGILEQKFNTRLNLTDWKPSEIEALYHIAICFENKDYAPPHLSLLRGPGQWDKTTSLFAEVLGKGSLEGGKFSPEELNLKIGLSYTLNRRPTVISHQPDGSMTTKKVDPLSLSLTLDGGLGIGKVPMGGPHVAPAASLGLKIEW